MPEERGRTFGVGGRYGGAVSSDGWPTGTVSFLFTDVEGSTRLWAADEEAMSQSLRLHDSVLRDVIETAGGHVFTTAGDSFAAAFSRASDAVRAATEAQAALGRAMWPGPALRVRMGIHMGEAEERNGDYFGTVVNTAARVEAAGHGGQVLITDPVRTMAGVDGLDLGFHRLRDVDEPMALFQVGPGDFPPLRVVNPWLSNLPERPTRLIGREDDVSKVRRLLGSHRLVTLNAVGGSGKTRLALAVGESELPHRPGGVWFVDLTAVMSDPEVPEAIAGAIGLSLRVGDPVDQVVGYLSEQLALVILDNCEHLVDSVADFAQRFLEVAGKSSLLATSREMLDVEGERIYRVSPLASDSPSSPGVTLFLDRATAIDPEFSITEANAASISALCARLDGLPLAIELAAIQVGVMTPAELLDGLDDRFQLLSGGRRRGRQRTLEATLDWSYDLLDDDSKRVFRSLGVFVDGFDLDAAAAVTGLTRSAMAAMVQSLVAKSLVVRLERGETSRFSMLESVKAYAEDRLVDTGEAAHARARHLDHFYGVANAHGRVLASEVRLCFGLRHDLSNLTAAFESAAAGGDWTRAAELLGGTFGAYEHFGRVIEGLALLGRVVDQVQHRDAELADHLLAQSLPALATVDDFAQAQRNAIRISSSSVPCLRVIGLTFHGWAVSYSQPDRSKKLLAQAQEELDGARLGEPGRNTEIAAVILKLYRAGHLCVDFEYEAALQDALEALAIGARLDYVATPFAPEAVAAMILVVLGRTDEALELLSRSDNAIIQTMQVATSESLRALALLERGDLETGREVVQRLSVRGVNRRYAYEPNDCVVLLAALALAEHDDATATALVLCAGTGSGWAVIVADHLAQRLDVTAERRRRILESIRSRDTAQNTGRATQALRDELHRRHWLGAPESSA
jgi:predicted ATPase/class 3 adenylate cyclase